MRSRSVKRMGYLSDQQGIINRYLREQGGWDSHLYRCRNYILESVDRSNPALITILGSGWLLDIPLEELVDRGIRVNLVDINHPSQVVRKVSQFNNVNLVQADITQGLIERIWEAGKVQPGELSEITVQQYRPGFDCGLIFSVNLLTQLDMLLVEYISNNNKLDHSELREFRKKVQESHIDFLKSEDAVIITDFREEIWSDGEISSESDLIFTELPGGKNTEEWDWEFDTHGLYYTGKKVIFKVKATELAR